MLEKIKKFKDLDAKYLFISKVIIILMYNESVSCQELDKKQPIQCQLK